VSATLFATSVAAADPAPQPPAASPVAAATPANGASKELAYRVVIVAPSPIKAAIEKSVSLERWQTYSDMTVELLDRLAREAKEEARNAAAAEGYFSAQVDYAVDRDVKPPVVTLTVTPGESSRIAKVDIDVTGPATTDVPLGTQAIAALRDGWTLPKGEVFQQSAWSAAKNRALATLRTGPYAAAKIDRSEAYIDPDARTADLSIALASGPPFRFGAFDVTGLTKYPPSVVTNYSSIHPGDPYSEAALEQFIRRLNSTGYFASVQAAIDPATTHPEDATVQVAVVEAPTRTFEGGIGYSTDVRYTAKLSYHDVNIDGKGLQLLADGQLDGNIQSASLRLVQPANASGWIGTWVVGAGGTDIEGLVTRTELAGTRWYTLDERRQTALSATYYIDDQSPDNAPSSVSHALYLETEQYIREVDQLLSPTRGWMVSGQAGGGIPGASTRGFGRRRTLRRVGSDRRKEPALLSRRRRCGDRVVARRHSVAAALSNGRRHNGARLRIPESRRPGGQRDRRRTLLRGGERRSDALDRRSMGIGRVRGCRQCGRFASGAEPRRGIWRRRACAHTARAVPPRPRLRAASAPGAAALLRGALVLA